MSYTTRASKLNEFIKSKKEIFTQDNVYFTGDFHKLSFILLLNRFYMDFR